MNIKKAPYGRLVVAFYGRLIPTFIILLMMCIGDNRASATTLQPASSQAAETALDQPNKAVQPAQQGQPEQPTSEYFQLTYPFSSKWTKWYTDFTHPRYVDYSSIIDHSPPFYQAYSTLDLWTGEYGATTGSGSDACGDLGPTFREYCYNGHPGLDMPVESGHNVRASHAGLVVRGSESGFDGGYGTTVFLRDETNPAFITRYSHLTSASVAFGTHVARGDIIGLSGCSGGGCAGAHLHWGLYYDETWNDNHPDDTPPGQVLDPYGWMSMRANNIGAPVTDYKWASGYSSQGSTNEPPTFSLNEGTVQGSEYINKARVGNGPHPIGAAGVDTLEQWWANDYGAAGPPLGDRYGSPKTGYCQVFEGGTYCLSGYIPYAFTDVPISNWAHRYIQWASREGIIGGYSDNTFKPSNLVTRGQISKMIMNGFSFQIIDPLYGHFADVPHGSTFYTYIETAYSNNVITGYQGDPNHWNTCLSTPAFENSAFLYFRWCEQVTRGQMTKFVANSVVAKEWITGLDTTNVGTSPGADFWDVPKTDAFFQHVRTLVNIGAIRYHRADGDVACTNTYTSANCQSMGHFFVGWSATRAQVAQILHETIYNLRPTNR